MSAEAEPDKQLNPVEGTDLLSGNFSQNVGGS